MGGGDDGVKAAVWCAIRKRRGWSFNSNFSGLALQCFLAARLRDITSVLSLDFVVGKVLVRSKFSVCQKAFSMYFGGFHHFVGR